MPSQLFWLFFCYSLVLGQYGPPFQGPQCQCNTETAWLDVVVLIEATTLNRYSELCASAGSGLGWFNVKTIGYADSNLTTHVGIVLYSDNAEVNAPLGTATQDDFGNVGFGPGLAKVSNGTTTNLAAGLKLAVEQFSGPGRRPNAPKIILLMSSFYNPEGVDSPVGIAGDFRASGGIIINYKSTGFYGDDSRVIQQLASPGFLMSNADGMGDMSITDALCQANCFCPPGYSSYETNIRGLPVAGCYSPASTHSTYEKASQICREQGGIVATGEDRPKMTYLNNLLSGHLAPPVPHRFFIGLTRVGTSNNWTWSDGTPMKSPQWRCSLCEISPLISCATGQVSIVYSSQPDGFWLPTECPMVYPFVCEVPPCDSVNYCP